MMCAPRSLVLAAMAFGFPVFSLSYAEDICVTCHEKETPGIPVLGVLPADLAVQEADRLGIPVYDHVPLLHTAGTEIAEELSAMINSEEN